ncbi:LTA synthase family protein [Aequorivita sp. H23M31]|uniref:LTA synthase family protein n=1 Tax=Aequorivita ciconiae TaxID=2494375 RepID=A0A410G6W2_9FLAO|nr:LTA synthase family protein [Aequorivita sp. H23M31]QAA83024.1 LTA synthase family protein [Aequorivita sp. H23M31]
MRSFFRINEYLVLLYRLLLAYVFYFIARWLFFIYNKSILNVDSFGQFLKLAYYGLAFDTTAILYLNALFVLLSILPLFINTTRGYQKFLFYTYFIFNLAGYALNFVDFIYYKYTFARTTIVVWDLLEHESNGLNMFFRFLVSYWHVYLLFFLMAFLWIYLYKRVRVKPAIRPIRKIPYLLSSLIGIAIIGILMIGGIRGGDFKKSTRPINMLDASRHVDKIEHSDIVLNTPFAFIRTFNANTFKKAHFDIPENTIENLLHPIKHYTNNPRTTPNIVLFITESYGREYWGAFNKDANIPDYESFTPFLDSLAQHSLIFSNAYANGSKSIHGMSSVLAGIPSFKNAFTSSSYSKQDIESLVSTLEDMGYDTSFFHGAPNGSMGFLGFGNILGFDHYYGKTEYNNDEDFDGSWGIWDEPFFQFMKTTLDEKTDPFFATIFTVSSHEPYIIPEKYEGKFPKGYRPMHQTVGYTDYAFKKFFESARKEPWFDNTIFVITADHSNQIYFTDFYGKVMNRSAIPILIYKPDGTFVGDNKDLAQQIDIYPTLLDIIGYSKPFRSWGRSLVGDKIEPPFVMNGTDYYQLQRGNYICIFDGEKAIGFYDIEDKGLTKNLIANRNAEMDECELFCKAFLQDYYERIVDKKL